MNKLKSWIHAARPRTLPLALSSTLLGSFLADADHAIKIPVLVFAIITTILLQILSNLANDYGDFTKGTDRQDRIGPKRMVATGAISPKEMKLGVIFTSILALISGSILILVGIPGIISIKSVIFLLLGLAAIAASIKYTVGKKPYGYVGLGDIAVFIFFGLIGVVGTYYLHTGALKFAIILPAISIGLLSAGVLNLNNMRDEKSDIISNKRTLVVLMGGKIAKFYHFILILGSIISATAYTIICYKSPWQLLFFLATPLLVKDINLVFKNINPEELNPELRYLALSTFIFSICFGLGNIL